VFAFQQSIGLPGADPNVMFFLGAFIVVLVAAFFLVWLRVYSISYVYLDSAGLTAVNWQSLFNKQNVQAEWSDVEDVSVVTSGFFAQMLGFGTLNIQTAGTRENVRMVMVPNAEHWQEVINYYQNLATPDTQSVIS